MIGLGRVDYMIKSEKSDELVCSPELFVKHTLTGKRCKCEDPLVDEQSSKNDKKNGNQYNEYDSKHGTYVNKGITLYALNFINKITKENPSKIYSDNSPRLF